MVNLKFTRRKNCAGIDTGELSSHAVIRPAQPTAAPAQH
jgi:hypothetical protein